MTFWNSAQSGGLRNEQEYEYIPLKDGGFSPRWLNNSEMDMAKNARWTREQLLVALRLYCSTPFGKLHNRNPEIIRLANLIGRTPDALGMKACNFASLDPAQRARGVQGLKGRSKADERLWADFEQNAEAIAADAESAWECFTDIRAGVARPESSKGVLDTRDADESQSALATPFPKPQGVPPSDPQPSALDPSLPTEVEQLIRARRVQRFFRNAVLISYDHRCALTGLSIPALLNASHIIPWSESEPRRADPRNGLCLNALHDRAFDRGLLTFDEDYRAVVSPHLTTADADEALHPLLLTFAGRRLQLPTRFLPDAAALAWHRAVVFRES